MRPNCPSDVSGRVEIDANVERTVIRSGVKINLSNKIDGEELYSSVIELRHRYIDKCEEFQSKLISEEIKDFYPNKNAFKLRGFLSNLYFDCEHFEDEFDDPEFYTLIENTFFESGS